MTHTHNKTIVFDLDDTICTTFNRDFENAIPNLKLIAKMQQFRDQGFIIHIITARGQISCKGDIFAASVKYREQIEIWLGRYNVPYDALSFNKILAQFYVDDKAIRPEEMEKIVCEQIKTGKSGAYVLRAGDKVYKTTKNAKSEMNWYHAAENCKSFKTPEIHSLVGDTISMEYIEESANENLNLKLKKAAYVINEFRGGVNWINKYDWRTYVIRIEKHLVKNDIIEECRGLRTYLKSISNIMVQEASFSHGDLTLENMIMTPASELYLIDSIYNNDLYSSWLIDLSKLVYSLNLRGVDKEKVRQFYGKFPIHEKVLKALELCHWIRVLSYIKNPKERTMYIYKIKNIHNEIFK
jgi:capsule biosynthesis phosphatase